MLKFFNTLTHTVEEFKPVNPPYVGYYSCGPTVYDYAHIGHARTYIFADILERVLLANGYKVVRVMNITDVGHLTSDSDTGEDKMEKGAAREKKSVWDIASFYTEDFFAMLESLNIKKPKIITKATDYIPQMIALVQKLENRGFTYLTGDGVYFNTSMLKDYGKLTGSTFEELETSLKAGARVEIVAGKKNVTDFALWKLTPQGVKRQMEWDSPWGRGFPGWHIECSAMSMDRLGESFDIHTGGIDHIAVHHTNEIAQSEAATGKPFVKYWLHAGHLTIEGEKMSKSLGNYFRVEDLIQKGFSPLALRYLFLQASYRKEMNFTWESMKASQNSYDDLVNKVSELKKTAGAAGKTVQGPVFTAMKNKFMDCVNDDLNTASALAILWQVLKGNLSPGEKLDSLYFFDEVLGLKLKETGIKIEIKIPDKVSKLVLLREEARKRRDFNQADKFRREIEREGFVVEDSPMGPIVKSS